MSISEGYQGATVVREPDEGVRVTDTVANVNAVAYVIWVALFFTVAAPLLGIDPEVVPNWAREATLLSGP